MRCAGTLGRTGFLALAAVFALSFATLPSRSADGADTPAVAGTSGSDVETRAALESLRSPYLVVREEGVAKLRALGPAARKAVLDAFAVAKPVERESLVRVLAADGSAESVDALLSALVAANPTEARGIEQALIEQAEALEAPVAAWVKQKGESPRIRDLEEILRRARIEAAFLSRKSRSGSTGYYHGQFDVLLPERKEALRICFAILGDRAVRLPGEFPAGGFRFLRDPPFFVEAADVRAMAGNAVAELVRVEDTDVIPQLEALRQRLRNVDDDADEGLGDRVLAILYHLDPDTYEREAEIRVATLFRQLPQEAAALLLLLGKYEEAIAKYQYAILRTEVRALAHYNIACAYASWSLEKDDRMAPVHRLLAMQNLETAVVEGFIDWPWIEQDRDLDPIRSDPRYARLLAKVKAEFIPPMPGGVTTPRPLGPGGPPAPPPAMDGEGRPPR